ncbi:MAG: septum formation protein [Halioglobus sp.]|jgi:septum formation protein
MSSNEGVSAKSQVILASQSPQRKILLEQVGYVVNCRPVDIEETPLTSELPKDLVVRLALSKVGRCFELREAWSELEQVGIRAIIGADTTIDLDNTSLGKPAGESDAMDMLRRLAGREHLVHTGVCVIDVLTGGARTQLVTTVVRFGPISMAQAKRYWDSGEPIGKAGAYGIQGLGAQFVAHLSGSYSNVVGLPLYETLQLVEKVT